MEGGRLKRSGSKHSHPSALLAGNTHAAPTETLLWSGAAGAIVEVVVNVIGFVMLVTLFTVNALGIAESARRRFIVLLIILMAWLLVGVCPVQKKGDAIR